MATSEDRRLDALEKSITPSSDDEIRVSINWGDPGTVLDHDTGERVTEQEWRKRHPGDKLIIVTWDDVDYE